MKVNASPQMAQFMALRGGEESLGWVFYDIQDFAAGVAIPTEVRFFARQQNGTTITAEDTNLMVASQPCSEGQRFLATNIGVSVLAGAAVTGPVFSGDIPAATVTTQDDIAHILTRGHMTLQLLGQKTYVDGAPLTLYPSGMGLAGSVAVSTTDVTTEIAAGIVNNGTPNMGNLYRFILPIPSKTTVNAIIRFPKGAITPVNAVRIGVHLYGTLFRAVQ